MSAYGEDLAHIHDVGFGGFSRDAAPGILRILRAAGVGQGRLVDLGCGSRPVGAFVGRRRLRGHQAGFRVRIVRGYGAMRFRQGQVGFLARKPARDGDRPRTG